MAAAEAGSGQLDSVPGVLVDHGRNPSRCPVAQPADVDRVGQDVASRVEGQAGLFGDLAIGHPLGGSREHGSDPLQLLRHGLQDGRLTGAPIAVWRLAAGLAQATALGGQALADATAELAAVGLGLDGLAGEVFPAAGVGREDALVAEQDRHPGGVEVI
jgi:hypothetical protein